MSVDEEPYVDSPAPLDNEENDERPPFRRVPRDRWLDIALVVTGVAVVALAAYVTVSYATQNRTQSTTSLTGRAIENLQEIVRKSPGNESARVKLADALVADTRFEQAIEQYKAALKINKDSVTALAGLGLVAMHQKDYKTSEGYWLKIVELLDTGQMAAKDLRLEQAYFYLGTLYIDMKRYEDAAANLKEALRIRRDNSNTHYALSVTYRELDLPVKQREELETTLAFDPGKPEANYDLGLLTLKDGDLGTAAELFRISADNAPNTDLPRIELQKLGTARDHLEAARQFETLDPAKALTEARIASAIDPANPESVRLVAKLWEVRKDPTRALNAWQRLLEMLPEDPAALDAILRLNPDGK